MLKKFVVMVSYTNNGTNEWKSFDTLTQAFDFENFVSSESYKKDYSVGDVKTFRVITDTESQTHVLVEIK